MRFNSGFKGLTECVTRLLRPKESHIFHLKPVVVLDGIEIVNSPSSYQLDH